MAAGLREPSPLLDKLTTVEGSTSQRMSGTASIARQLAIAHPPLQGTCPTGEGLLISFSGGVADCIEGEVPWLEYGDIGPVLGRAIRESCLCAGEYRLGSETIRATVIGAGCHSAQLSGSTVYHQNIAFPLKNLPVVRLSDISALPRELEKQEGPVVIAMEGPPEPSYRQVADLAQQLLAQLRIPILLCLEQDMAKALGQALALRLPEDAPLLCIDRIRVTEGSYLDIAAPLSHALPVVVKTLVLGN